MEEHPFELTKHIYANNAFDEIVLDAIRFFHGSPVCSVPPNETFNGQGVYALYYIGPVRLYRKYYELNRVSYSWPIYVGKAVPKGWRQSRRLTSDGSELATRLREHARNIVKGKDLSQDDFRCRFVVFADSSTSMIATIESRLIKMSAPLWNSVLDGFGNHDPGSGRRNQRKSDWDVIHPGRPWAERLTGRAKSEEEIVERINDHMTAIDQ